MGLDVYVGSLTRYYAEGPADVVERIARHQGMARGPDGQLTATPPHRPHRHPPPHRRQRTAA